MKVFRAAIMVALLTGPAYAQTPNINLIPEMKSKTPEEVEQEKVLNKAYQDSLRKIPDAKVSNDPWGNVRGAGGPAPATRAKAHAKTRKSAN